MVYRQGIVPDGHLHAARVGQLLTVNLRTHAPLGGCLKDACCLVDGEEALVAEHVYKVGQLLTAHFGNHLVDDQVDVFALSARISAPYGMGSEEGALHAERGCLLDAADDA